MMPEEHSMSKGAAAAAASEDSQMTATTTITPEAESSVNSDPVFGGAKDGKDTKGEVKSGKELTESGVEAIESNHAAEEQEHHEERNEDELTVSSTSQAPQAEQVDVPEGSESIDTNLPRKEEPTLASSEHPSSATLHKLALEDSNSNEGTKLSHDSPTVLADTQQEGGNDEPKAGKSDVQNLGDDQAAASASTKVVSLGTEEDKVMSKVESSSDRDLPAPPTPSKETQTLPQEGSRAEVDEVAKAFGAKVKMVEEPQGAAAGTVGAASSSQGENSLDVPFSPESGRDSASPKTPRTGIRIGKGPPPTTQASEEKPFDFNRFLEQMKHKSAGPVGEYVRSFIKGFTKKPYRVSDQTKLIFDFLDFIALRMRVCEVWARLGSTEFENAIEAMEKLLMNRLYTYTFSPAVKKEGKWTVQTDDLERDRVLKQRIRLFSWITEEHLDVPVGSHSKGFIDFAMEELHKINHYKAPRDKVICILNCCKVIFGLIRHLSSEENADTFIPILIFVVLRANPDNLISNVEYISRFRNPERLSSESGYYLSSLMGAIAFIETMDYTSLSNITKEEFEARVEEAVEKLSSQPESVESSPARVTDIQQTSVASGKGGSARMTPQGSASSGEHDVAGGASSSGIRNNAMPMSAGAAAAIAEDTRAFFQRTGEAARAGIGASLGKPMGALGRLFQEGLDGPRTPSGAASSSSAMSSGRATPDTPPGAVAGSTVGGGQHGGVESTSARSRMWGLFGVDDDELKRRQQLQQQHQQQAHHEKAGGNERTPRSTSGTSLNFGSWSRSMNDEAEPQTPVSEELIQGRFAPLGRGDGRGSSSSPQEQPSLQAQLAGAPMKAQRQPPAPHRRPRPQRLDSIDPYSIQDDGVMASGTRTPPAEYDDDFGSDIDTASPSRATTAGGGGRPRVSNLNSFLPSFLSDPQMNKNVSSSAPRQQQQPQRNSIISSLIGGGDDDDDTTTGNAANTTNDSFNDEEAAEASAAIEEAHLSAGVETLKSIFPTMDSSVCRLVLEDCHGDVQGSIDKLLEMQ